MRLCVITGASPFSTDVVGQFSLVLADRFDGSTVVYSGPGEDEVRQTRTPTHRVSAAWGLRTFVQSLRWIRRSRADVVLVHYVPQLYGWLGMKPTLPLLLLWLRVKGYVVITVFHEIAMPFGQSASRDLLAIAHRVLLRPVVAASRKLVVTTGDRAGLLASLFPRRRMDVVRIPISSPLKIAPYDRAAVTALESRVGIHPDDFVVACFASVADPDDELQIDFLRWMLWTISHAHLVFLGKRGQQRLEFFVRDEALRPRIHATGFISDADLSLWLQRAHVVAGFYRGGASTRRSSLMLPLAHRVAIISNSGPATDEELLRSRGIAYVNAMDDSAALSSARTILTDDVARREVADQGKRLFDDYYSWDRLASQYGRVFSDLVRERAA